jgi:DNA (cytosine-5)-methyltransferase 1
MNELALFAGVATPLVAKLTGCKIVCAVELDGYAATILALRQNDGLFDPFPIWSDIRTFNPEPWRGIVECISAGFPCQDISVANKEAKGIKGSRSGLWSEVVRIGRVIQPKLIKVENSPMLTIRGLDRVLFDLAQMGYNAKWGCIGAGAIGSVCEGERIWLFATPANSTVLEGLDIPEYIKPYSEESRRRQYTRAIGAMLSQDDYTRIKRDTNVVARRMDRLKAIGNGQVPGVASKAWHVLCQRIGPKKEH